MTSSAASRDDTTLPGWVMGDVAERRTTRPVVPAPFLFALGFATALPPATLRPPRETLPTVYHLAGSAIGPEQVSAVLGRPVRVAGRGNVLLGEVDTRLAGLAASLDVYQATGERGVLAALGIVRPAPAAGPGATVAGLWRLARGESARLSATWARLPGLGDDAFRATYGNTVQVAWLAGGRVGTVSLTDLYADRARVCQATRSLATVAEQHLSSRGDPDGSPEGGQTVPLGTADAPLPIYTRAHASARVAERA